MAVLTDNMTQFTDSQRENCLDTLAEIVCRRRLHGPAIFVLEMYRPLARTLHAISIASLPLLVPVFGVKLARLALAVLEEPAHVEQLIRRIEEQA